MKKYLVIFLVFLNFCTTSAGDNTKTVDTATTSDLIIQKINRAGLNIYDFEYNSWNGQREQKVGSKYDSDWFLYSERVSFTIDEVAPKGGQFFICETKTECDLIWQHYEDLKSLAGPYRFRSQDGKLVAQLNSGLSLKTGVSFQTIFEGLDNLTVTNR